MLRINEEEKQMMRSLYNLRYLRMDQIRSLWWSDREGEGARIRMSRMRKEGFLALAGVLEEASAVRLAAGGVGFLRRFCEGGFNPYDELRPIFLPHLLATNDVFFALAGDEWRFDDLPFEWVGSHRARIEFLYLQGGELGVAFCRKRRVLAPDAIVVPRGRLQGARCFIELDRSTEAIAEAPGRRSIVGKLKAYRELLHQPQPVGGTAYDARFRDRRAARVVFVVAKKDRAERRLRSIKAAAKQIAPDIDVRVVALEDIAGLRSACLGDATGLRVAAAPVCQKKAVELTSTSLQYLIDFHVGAAPVLTRASFENTDERARLISLYDQAREVLRALRDQGVG